MANTDYVTVYGDPNYNGANSTLAEGSFDINSLGISNDQLSSLKVPPGMRITLYEHAGFQGRTKVFTSDTPYVGDDFNEKTSSIKIERTAENPVQQKAPATPNVLLFDGITYCSAPLNAPENAYTASIWFKTSSSNCGLFSADAGEMGSNGHDRHIWLKDGNIYTRLWSNEVIATAGKNFADGKWHKVTHVFGGAIGGQRIYADGVLEAKGAKAVSDLGLQDGINVGFSNDASSPYFTGEISEVAIWSVARRESDIVAMQEMLIGNETGLLAYWNFMDGQPAQMIVRQVRMGGVSMPKMAFQEAQIVSRTAEKLPLIVKGNAKWQRSYDFSGVFVPVVNEKQVRAIRAEGNRLYNARKPLPDGYTFVEDTQTPAAYSQLVSQGALPQVEAAKRIFNAIQNNTLAVSKDLLGSFGEVAEVAGGVMSGYISLSSPFIQVVKITPGVSGEDGQPFGDPATDMSLATVQTTAVKLSGEASLLSRMQLKLKYAEFAQLKGRPYGVMKFVSTTPLGIGTFLPNVPLLDAMVISSPTFILSSSGELKDAPLNTGLVKGFNFFGSFKLGDARDERFNMVGGLLGIPEILLHGAVDVAGPTPAYLIEAAIPFEKYIINSSNFKMRFSKAMLGITIKGQPLEPALFVAGEMIVSLKKGAEVTHLVFTGGLKLEAESVTGSFTMQAENEQSYTLLGGNVVAKGEWKEPFGIPGIAIRELAMQVGITYQPPWIDNVGVHGNLRIGDLDGSISVLVDINDPDQFVLAGATDHITLLQIMSCMSVPTFVAYRAVPSNIKQVMDKFVDLRLEDVKIHIAPVAASIGAIDFEQGVEIRGNMTAWGWHSSVSVKVDYESGLEINGQMDKINFYDVFKVTGSQNDPLPLLHLKLSPKETPELLITGKVYLLGLSQETRVKADASGFTFFFDRALAGTLDTKLTCSIDERGFAGSGSINFNLNVNIPTPFGTIPLSTSFNAAAGIKAGPRYGFELTVEGSFSFMGKSITMPSLKLRAAPNDFTALFNAVVKQITDAAETIFKPLFSTLSAWANAVKNGVIRYSGEVATVARNVYNAAEKDVIAAYKTLSKGPKEIAKGFKDVYGYSENAVTSALKGAGYAVNEVGNAVKGAYNLTAETAAKTLKGAGYAVYDVGNFVKGSYNLSAGGVASALNFAGYATNEAGDFVKNTFNLGANELKSALEGAGYATDQVKSFFQSLGGSFASVFKDFKEKINPKNWF